MDNQTRRSRVLKLRKAISQDQNFKNSLDVVELLRDEFVSLECLDVYDKDDARINIKILAFYPLDGEVDLRRLYDELLAEGIELYFPKTAPDDYSMEFYRVDDLRDFIKGEYGVMEPVITSEDRRYLGNCEDDIIICPGVLFDKKGNRAGFGKGYYDRYLMRYNLKKMAVAFEFQVYDEISSNDWDVPMDMLFTERNVYRWK